MGLGRRRVMSMAARLHEALALTGGTIVLAGYGERVSTIASLIDHQEPVIAFEILCSNLHDFDCPVSRRAYTLLEGLGQSLGIIPATWEVLGPQVVAGAD